MTLTTTCPMHRSLAIGVLFALTTGPVWAELYKCRQPDGSLSYQQTVCAAQSEGERLQLDTRGPDGRAGPASGEDYSVAAQAERLRAEREASERAHLKARREAESLEAKAGSARNTDFDPAKCARHRGEVAKWRQKANGTYRTRDEKDYNDSRLAHHRALVERYCE